MALNSTSVGVGKKNKSYVCVAETVFLTLILLLFLLLLLSTLYSLLWW